MRILLTLHCHLDRNSGAPGSILSLAEEYRAAGHETRVLSFDDFPSRIPPRIRPVLFPWLVLYHATHTVADLDVVNSSSGDAWLCMEHRSRRRTALGRVLIVSHSHGLEHLAHEQLLQDSRAGRLDLSWKYPLYNGGFRLWEVSRSLRRAHLSLFLNEPELEYAVTQLGVPRHRARVTANGLPSEFLGLPFEDTPLDRDAGIGIAQIGTYIQRKGIEYGSPALNAIMREHLNVRVLFLGTSCPPEHVLRDFDPGNPPPSDRHTRFSEWRPANSAARVSNQALSNPVRGLRQSPARGDELRPDRRHYF